MKRGRGGDAFIRYCLIFATADTKGLYNVHKIFFHLENCQ